MVGKLKRGQGATEYLMLLAVVLVVVMIVLSLIGSFPKIGGDLKKAQSESYWSGSAKPIRVEQSFLLSEFKGSSTQSNLTMLIENMEDTWITINSILVSPGNFTEVYGYNGEYLGNASDLNLTLTSGSRKVVVLVDSNGSYAPPRGFEVDLGFKYTTAYGTPGEQRGQTPLAGDAYLTFEQSQEERGCVLLLGMFWWCPDEEG